MKLKNLNVEAYYADNSDLAKVVKIVEKGRQEAHEITIAADIVRIGNRIFFNSDIIASNWMHLSEDEKACLEPPFSKRIVFFQDKAKNGSHEFQIDGGSAIYGQIFGLSSRCGYSSAMLSELEHVMEISGKTYEKAPDAVNNWYKTNLIHFAKYGVGLNAARMSESVMEALSLGEEQVPYVPYKPNFISHGELCRQLAGGRDFSEIDFYKYSNLDDKGEHYELDLRGVKGVTAKRLMVAKDLIGVKIPDGLDFAGVDFVACDCLMQKMDLSKAVNLNLASALNSFCFRDVIMPEYLDLAGAERCKLHFLDGYDFSQTRNFPSNIINWHSSIGVYLTGTKFPENFDPGPVDWSKVKGARMKGCNLSVPGVDLKNYFWSRVYDLTDELVKVCKEDLESEYDLERGCQSLAEKGVRAKIEPKILIERCRGKTADEVNEVIKNIEACFPAKPKLRTMDMER